MEYRELIHAITSCYVKYTEIYMYMETGPNTQSRFDGFTCLPIELIVFI